MVFIVGVIVLAIILAARSRKLVANREREIRSTADFSADDVYVSPYSRNGLAIDNARGLVMLVDTTRQRKVSFEKLVSAEVMEDNVTLMTTKRGLGGVVVGGLLFGEVGAIVGGLTGRQASKSSTGVRSVTLVVVVDDFNAPRHSVTFMRWADEKGLSKNSALYRQAIEKAQLWQSRLTIAMRHAEQFKQSPESVRAGGAFTQPSSALASAPTAMTTKQARGKAVIRCHWPAIQNRQGARRRSDEESVPSRRFPSRWAPMCCGGNARQLFESGRAAACIAGVPT